MLKNPFSSARSWSIPQLHCISADLISTRRIQVTYIISKQNQIRNPKRHLIFALPKVRISERLGFVHCQQGQQWEWKSPSIGYDFIWHWAQLKN